MNKPGVYELPLGYNLKKMIDEVGGGVWKGRKLKAVVPGGSSVPILKADEIDVAMDFDSLMKIGTFLGSGGVIVLDDQTCIVKFLQRTIDFYQHESCGWCIPCREGTDWLKEDAASVSRRSGRGARHRPVEYLADNMLGRTFCPLGDAAAMPVSGHGEEVQRRVRGAFERHVSV